MSAQPNPPPSRAAAAARATLQKHDDVSAAAKDLEQQALADPVLYQELVGPYLAQACYEEVRSQSREIRSAVWNAPNYAPGGHGGRLEALGLSLLDFRLPSGLPLRLARRDDLLEAARFYRTQARDMEHKGRWLESIAGKVGRRSVGSALTDADLEALRVAATPP